MTLNKDLLIDKMADNMPVLRACLGLSQAELAQKVGLSRYTVGLIESHKRKMTWKTFRSLYLVFSSNEKASKCIPFLFGFSGLEIEAAVKNGINAV